MVRPPRIVASLLLAVLVITACSSSGRRAASTNPAAGSSGAPSNRSSSSTGSNSSDISSAGDIPDNQVFVAFTFTPGPFTVKIPEGWSRTNSSDGSVRFTDNFNAIDLNGSPSADAPSEQSALGAEVPALQASTPGFELHNVSTVQRKSGPAVMLAYHATSAPNTVTGKTITLSVERYEFWQAGNKAIVTVSGPRDADNVDPWRTVTDSFAWS